MDDDRDNELLEGGEKKESESSSESSVKNSEKNSMKNSEKNSMKNSEKPGKATDKLLGVVNGLMEKPEFHLSLILVYLEVIFHFVRTGGGISIITKILFGIVYGFFAALILRLFAGKTAKVLSFVMIGVTSVYFIADVIYSGVFNTYLSVMGTLGYTNQALDFTDVIFKEMAAEWWVILLMLIPIVVYSVFSIRFVSFDRPTGFDSWNYSGWRQYIASFVTGIVLFAGIILGMKCAAGAAGNEYSAYWIFKSYSSVDMAVEKLGVTTSMFLDMKQGTLNALGIEKKGTGFASEGGMTGETAVVSSNGESGVLGENGTSGDLEVATTEEVTTEEVIDTSPNVLDVDVDKLIEEETDSSIIELHEYIKTVTPTNKNKYTGMFEGYNVIYVTAEGFSGYVVDPERTPTLYKMVHKGFYFKNYYTPLWYGSTLGGEYADLTGNMPKNGGYLSMAKCGKKGNDMMFTLARQLGRKGYKTMGFHDNDYTYYDRDISHVNMGYDWIGVGNGLEAEKSNGSALWPQSDLKMIDDTFDMYAGEEPFHTYYLTVSGHVMYNFGGNAMAARHKDFVEDLNYSDTTKAYIACQYELELAMTELIAKLEAAGIADRTLIVLTADHVPYDNKDVVDELAGETLDNTFGWYKNALVIWSPSMEHPVQVSKYCSSLDILPTVSNLLGLDYDSRMMVGRDILSDCEGIVMFNDRSFITDSCSYNANTGEVKSFGVTEVSDEYVDSIKTYVKNKFSMSEEIVNTDYYRVIDEAVYGADETTEESAE